MSTSLPQEIHDDLDAAVSLAFERCLERATADSQSTSAQRDRLRAEIILGSVHLTLARLLRTQNARNALHNHLPNELWCSIWSFLPFESRVAVSQTCSGWRGISVGCPELWTDLNFFVTAHETDCQCSECQPDRDTAGDERPHPRGWKNNPYLEGSSNISLALIVLSRSADLPLSLTLHLVAYRPLLQPVVDLASALSGHRHRVREINVRTAELLAARDFLEDAGDWPALQHLTIGEIPNDLAFIEEGCVMLPTGMDLPQLESVSLLGNSMWPDPDWGQYYPSVKSVAFQPADRVGFELRSILVSCTQLCVLDLDLTPIRSWPDESLALIPELPKLASCLREVRIRKLWANFEDYVLDIFELATRMFLSLEYECSADVARGRRIFRELRDAAHLSVSCRDGMLSVLGQEDDGRTRRVAVRSARRPTRKGFTSIVSSESIQPFQDVRSVSVDGCLWFHLIGAMPSYPSLASLEVVIDNTTLPWIEAHRPQIPALQSLTLLSYDGVVKLSAPMIGLFVRNLKVRIPIPILRIDHRLEPGPAGCLRNVAQTVSVGVYHVKV